MRKQHVLALRQEQKHDKSRIFSESLISLTVVNSTLKGFTDEHFEVKITVLLNYPQGVTGV